MGLLNLLKRISDFFDHALFSAVMQLERTGLAVDTGLGESVALTDRLAAANGEALSLADEVRVTAVGAFEMAGKGATELGNRAMGLRDSAEKASRLSGEATGVASSLGNLTKEASQVCCIFSVTCCLNCVVFWSVRLAWCSDKLHVLPSNLNPW
jgi:hypothetical protein